MRIAQISDCHLHADETELHYGIDADRTLHGVLDAVEAWDPDVIVASGDLADQGSASAYRRLDAAFERFNAPIFAMPGNHDDIDVMRASMREGRVHTSGEFVLEDWRLLILDSTVAGQDYGKLADSQLELLGQALGSDDTSTVVFIHHHPVPVGSPWIDQHGLRNPEELFEQLNRTRCVKALAFGHIHQVFETQLGDLRLMSAPATSSNGVPRQETFIDDNVGPGYRRFELRDGGILNTEVVRIELPQNARRSAAAA